MSRRHPLRPTDLTSELPPISYVWETPNRRPRRAEWDIPDPAAPRRLTTAMRVKLERIVRRAPEVMVKITGRTKDVAHLKSHLAYITRNALLCFRIELAVSRDVCKVRLEMRDTLCPPGNLDHHLWCSTHDALELLLDISAH